MLRLVRKNKNQTIKLSNFNITEERFMGKGLFVPVVEEVKLSEVFLAIKNNYQYMPVKMMLEEIFEKYNDVDGNFIEQFQTKGFNARLLELYFFEYFDSENYKIDRSHQYPDYIVEKNRKRVAVEITTANGAYGKDGGVTINKNHYVSCKKGFRG